jgi:hypothetical protein
MKYQLQFFYIIHIFQISLHLSEKNEFDKKELEKHLRSVKLKVLNSNYKNSPNISKRQMLKLLHLISFEDHLEQNTLNRATFNTLELLKLTMDNTSIVMFAKDNGLTVKKLHESHYRLFRNNNKVFDIFTKYSNGRVVCNKVNFFKSNSWHSLFHKNINERVVELQSLLLLNENKPSTIRNKSIKDSHKMPTENFPYKNATEYLIDFKNNHPIY